MPQIQSLEVVGGITIGGAAVAGVTSSCLRMLPRLANTPMLVTSAIDAMMYRASDAILRVAFNVAVLSIRNGNSVVRSQ